MLVTFVNCPQAKCVEESSHHGIGTAEVNTIAQEPWKVYLTAKARQDPPKGLFLALGPLQVKGRKP